MSEPLRTLRWEQVRAGDALPELEVPLTATRIVAGALASRDFHDVHHDTEAARREGMPNVFMNILTTNGHVGRYVTDWAGPEALLRRVAIRLGAPNLPGDSMRFSGEVVSAEQRDGEGLVEVSVRGRNAFGDHVTGTVTLTLPLGSRA